MGGRGVNGSMEAVDFELADLLSGNVDDVQLLRVSEYLNTETVRKCDHDMMLDCNKIGI